MASGSGPPEQRYSDRDRLEEFLINHVLETVGNYFAENPDPVRQENYNAQLRIIGRSVNDVRNNLMRGNQNHGNHPMFRQDINKLINLNSNVTQILSDGGS
ncbi:GSCOCG00005461001-RA-CDS [Cotesia congregata]|uniref:Uncharacterized protein n=1 Tax=Cotesia congregata TaxID=51543 RepID=A0A8J2H6B7_COTCN|nr:GSCOCG00005461001-RA-CDS [Cotesia congregata]CAG5078307.1 Protein of unknown function [Cotesia congregata]